MHGSASAADNNEVEVRRGFVWTLKRLGRLGRANCSSSQARALDSVSQTLDSCSSTGGSADNDRRQPGCSLLSKPWLMGHGPRPDATGTAFRQDASKTAAAGAESDMAETQEAVNCNAVGAAVTAPGPPCRRSSTTDLPQQNPCNAAVLTYLRDGAVTPAAPAPSPSSGRRAPLLSHSTITICRAPRNAANTPPGGSPLPPLQPTICELSSWEAAPVPTVSHAALHSSPVHPFRSEQLLSSAGPACTLQQQLSAPLSIPAGWPHSAADVAAAAAPWTMGRLPQPAVATSRAFCPSPGAPGTPMPCGLVRAHSDATPPSLLARQVALDRCSPPGSMATAAAVAAAAQAPTAAASAGEGVVADGGGAAAATAAGAVSGSQLLAVCPNLPPGMRRQVWGIEDYTDVAKLFQSSSSAVYKATCVHSGLRVALKVYSLDRVPANLVHALVREVRIHAELSHRAVLTLYGVFQEASRLVLVLERAARGDLYQVHRRLLGSRMSEAQLAGVVLAPLLDALVYLHARGVCHRDIKPENLLLADDWTLRLADFGAAINLTEERAVTRTGTPDYMAPEVERCPIKLLPQDNKHDASLAYTTAADIWSVGVLAFEMLCGFPPLSSTNPYNEQQQQLGLPAGESPLRFPAFVSPGARDFIATCLAERPGDRPTAVQLLRHPWLKATLGVVLRVERRLHVV